MVDVEAKDKILRAKIQLQKSNPFFAYLISHLNIEENNDLKDSNGNKMETMCVDNKNNMFYSPKFVNKLSESQLTACICHEVMHKALEHIDRFFDREREPLTWNIATDICVNNLLLQNKFDIGIEGLILPYDNQIEVFGKKLKDLDKKTSEKIYDEIFTTIKKIAQKIGFTNSSNAGGKNKFGFDSHFFGNKKDKGNKSKDGKGGEGNSQEKNWKQIVSEAYTMAKNMGKTPLGVDRQLDELLNPKLDWKSLLYRHITNAIPHDYTYSRPSKHSQACGFYMPSMKREEVEVVVAVDTSGSIGQGELTEFLSEMVGISKAFSNVKMTCLICDCKIHDVLEFNNGNIDDILNTKIKGGGGTGHEPIYEWLDENKPNCKLMINFTDGETSVGKVNYPTLWVISEGGTDRVVKDKGEVIKL